MVEDTLVEERTMVEDTLVEEHKIVVDKMAEESRLVEHKLEEHKLVECKLVERKDELLGELGLFGLASEAWRLVTVLVDPRCQLEPLAAP